MYGWGIGNLKFEAEGCMEVHRGEIYNLTFEADGCTEGKMNDRGFEV